MTKYATLISVRTTENDDFQRFIVDRAASNLNFTHAS